MQRILLLFVYVLGWLFAKAADAGPIDQALMKLGPEERARQVCIIKGIETVRKDKRLSQADRMKTSILQPRAIYRHRCDREGRRGPHEASLVRAEVHLRSHRRSDEGYVLHLRARRRDPEREVGRLRSLGWLKASNSTAEAVLPPLARILDMKWLTAPARSRSGASHQRSRCYQQTFTNFTTLVAMVSSEPS